MFKKSKRILSLLMSLIMVLSMFTGLNLQSFAANAEIVVDYPEIISVGDSITVTVSGKNMAGLESAGISFYYDAECFEFVNAEAIGEAYMDSCVLFSEGQINWGGVYYPSAASENIDFMEITFTVLNAGDSEFKAVCTSSSGIVLPSESVFEISVCEHNYEVTEIVEPTCVDIGYTKYVCTLCGHSYNADYVDVTDEHNYEATETVEPTCESGYTKYVCTECGDSYNSDFVDAVDEHNYEATETVEPTCESGYTKYVCTECGDSYNSDFVDATDEHNSEVIETVEPFCGEDGYTRYLCSDCGDVYYNYIPATESHNYEEIESVKATCLEDGYSLYKCTKCGYEDRYTNWGHCEYESGSLYCKYCNGFALTYEIENGEVTIINCDGYIDGEFVIPEKIENYPVTTIANAAFYSCDMTRVAIPASVTTIENDIFKNCYNIEYIEVDEANKYYSNDEYGVLFNKDKTQLIQYPVGRSAEIYSVPDGVVLISSRTENTLSQNLNTRDAWTPWGAFYGCDDLEKLVIPSTVTAICDEESYSKIFEEYRDRTFDECRYLEMVIIYGKNVDIHKQNLCMNYNNNTQQYEHNEDSVIYGYAGTAVEQYAKDNDITFIAISDDLISNLYYEIADGEVTITGFKKSISGDIVIPDTIEGYPVTKMQVSDDAYDMEDINFQGCPMLTGITVPESVEIISGSFYGCASLENIKLGDNIKSLCNFYGTGYAENDANWENDLLYIGKYLVGARCTDKECNTVKDGTKLIANYVLSYSYCNCKEIILPDSLQIICDDAFCSNLGLEKIIIPDSVTDIGKRAFEQCHSLKTVVLPNNLTEIKERTFNKCVDLTEIEIPSSVKKIGNSAFTYSSLKMDSLIISDSVVEIGIGAFNNGTAFKSITIGKNVKYVGDIAFCNCATEKITILSKDVEIGNQAFGYRWNGLQENVEIHGYAGSTAEAYAKENGIKFVVLEEPTTQEPTTQEPTTQEPTTKEPTTNEPSTEKPAEDGELDVKDESGIGVDSENKTALIGEESRVADITAAIENENIKVIDKNGDELAADDLLGTGSKIQIFGTDGNILAEYTVIVPNDIDGNAKVTAADARLALRAGAKLDVIDELCYFTAADADGNGKINAADARKILRKAAGLE